MYDSYGYGQPMMQQMQMRQNDWQQRMQTRNAPRYEVIQVNGENGARAFAMAPNSSALLMDATAPIVWLCTTDGDPFYEFWAVMNALYCDYYAVAKKYNVLNADFFADMAMAFIHDKDAVKNKPMAYYNHIVQG